MVRIHTIKETNIDTFDRELDYYLNKGWELISEIKRVKQTNQRVVKYWSDSFGPLSEEVISHIATLKKVLSKEEEEAQKQYELEKEGYQKLEHNRDWHYLIKTLSLFPDRDNYIHDNEPIISEISKQSQVEVSLIIEILKKIAR